MKSLTTFLSSLTVVGKGTLISLASIIAVIVSMQTALIGLCILIFIDLLSGIRKNHHEWGIRFNLTKAIFWKSIKSYLLRQTWKKTYEYGLGIIVVLVFENYIFGQASIELMERTFTITELSILIPAIIEVWSIFENFEAVSGNNILKKLVDLFPEKLRNLFTGEKSEKNNEDDTDI